MASLLLPLLLALAAAAAAATSAGRLVPYDLLYADGVRAYLARQWPRAAELLQRSLHSYAGLREARSACRRACRDEVAFAQGPAAPWEAAFFERVLQRADCLQHCLGRRLGGPPSAHRVSHAIQRDFEQREPYNYLQVAFFQLKKLDQAVSAAHTFFVANPQHLQMREDIEKYRRMSGVKADSFRDLEATPLWEAYEAGVQHYNADEYLQAVARLEESLREALSALEECRTLCEGPWEEEEEEDQEKDGDQEEEKEDMQPGLYEAIAAHYVQVLKCRQQCVIEIATKPGRISATEDFIPSHLDLLQFAYDQGGNKTLAAECAASYLLFYPMDEPMLEKMNQYRTELGKDTAVKARENIQHYVQRSLMEKRLIYYAVEHLGGTFNDPDLWTPDELIPESVKEQQREDQEKQKQETLEVEEREKRGPLPFEGITVTMDSQQMNGTQRVVFDQVLTESECRDLLRLTKAAGGTGDGFRGRRSPHTPHERFEGLTVLKAMQLAQNGDVDWKDAELLLQASEKSRKIIESYFTPGKKLHFSFTHLVCRTAVEGEQEGRMDLSHPVHADNCLLDPEGNECWREPPAYVYRDYSGVLYLNDDFQGGGLFFTELDAVTVTAKVHPKCGRLVAFSSGKENPHGVWAVRRGRRCAVALWYTHSQEHAEKERMKAEELMEKRSVKQDKLDRQLHQGEDHGSSSSQESPMPSDRARTTGRRHKPSSQGTQHPKELRPRDEF